MINKKLISIIAIVLVYSIVGIMIYVRAGTADCPVSGSWVIDDGATHVMTANCKLSVGSGLIINNGGLLINPSCIGNYDCAGQSSADCAARSPLCTGVYCGGGTGSCSPCPSGLGCPNAYCPMCYHNGGDGFCAYDCMDAPDEATCNSYSPAPCTWIPCSGTGVCSAVPVSSCVAFGLGCSIGSIGLETSFVAVKDTMGFLAVENTCGLVVKDGT